MLWFPINHCVSSTLQYGLYNCKAICLECQKDSFYITKMNQFLAIFKEEQIIIKDANGVNLKEDDPQHSVYINYIRKLKLTT